MRLLFHTFLFLSDDNTRYLHTVSNLFFLISLFVLSVNMLQGFLPWLL